MHGNPDELHRMIRNLLENAVRHTPEKTTVELTARRDGDQALLEVLDDGPGIPAGIEEQVFDRFVRGDGPADTVGGGGSGLGLVDRPRGRAVAWRLRRRRQEHLRRRPFLDPAAPRARPRSATPDGPLRSVSDERQKL